MFFFFNDTATTEIYTLSLHDALPISGDGLQGRGRTSRPHGRHQDSLAGADGARGQPQALRARGAARLLDRKSTRLNSSHANISYAVFCLKKKKIIISLLLFMSTLLPQ